MSRVSMRLALTDKQEREIEAFCLIAKENGAVVSLRELIGLASIDASEHELATAFDSHFRLKSRFLLDSGYVLERSSVPEAGAKEAVEAERRRELAQVNLRKASRFGRTLLRGTTVVAVSGGNSYLSADEEEDIDFFCVTKTNGVWPFLLKALVLARIHRLANSGVPELCFSCVMDEKWATREFKKRQPPIFARDALMAKVIGGRSAYHALLKEATWMGEYFPSFYSMWLAETEPLGRQPPCNGAAREGGSALLNSFLFRTLGVFLRMKSRMLNRKLAKARWESAIFVTKMGPGHYIYESNRYRKLRSMYGEIEKDE